MNQNKAIATVIAVVVVGFFLGGLLYKGNVNPSSSPASVDNVANTIGTNAISDNSSANSSNPADNPGAQNPQTSQVTVAPSDSHQPTITPQFSTPKTMTTQKDGLKIGDISIGTGPAAKSGDHVYVNYVGTLTDGTKFDSSYDRGQPIDFTLGAGQVIPGWNEGLVGMKVGSKRELIIPPALAYGSQAVGPIPANSTLVFQVELMQIGASTAN